MWGEALEGRACIYCSPETWERMRRRARKYGMPLSRLGWLCLPARGRTTAQARSRSRPGMPWCWRRTNSAASARTRCPSPGPAGSSSVHREARRRSCRSGKRRRYSALPKATVSRDEAIRSQARHEPYGVPDRRRVGADPRLGGRAGQVGRGLVLRVHARPWTRRRRRRLPGRWSWMRGQQRGLAGSAAAAARGHAFPGARRPRLSPTTCVPCWHFGPQGDGSRRSAREQAVELLRRVLGDERAPVVAAARSCRRRGTCRRRRTSRWNPRRRTHRSRRTARRGPPKAPAGRLRRSPISSRGGAGRPARRRLTSPVLSSPAGVGDQDRSPAAGLRRPDEVVGDVARDPFALALDTVEARVELGCLHAEHAAGSRACGRASVPFGAPRSRDPPTP